MKNEQLINGIEQVKSAIINGVNNEAKSPRKLCDGCIAVDIQLDDDESVTCFVSNDGRAYISVYVVGDNIKKAYADIAKSILFNKKAELEQQIAALQKEVDELDNIQ